MISVRTKSSGVTWKLPIGNETHVKVRDSFNRTILVEDPKAGMLSKKKKKKKGTPLVFVQVSTFNPQTTSFTLKMDFDQGFKMKLDHLYTAKIDLNSPWVSFVNFPKDLDYAQIKINSKSSEEMVTLISESFPSLDQNGEIIPEPKQIYQVGSMLSGLRIPSDDYPNGCFLFVQMKDMNQTRCNKA